MVAWLMDDLKISHIKLEVVTKLIECINSMYGHKKLLSVTRGMVHKYLEMTLDFHTSGKVKILMKKYIKKMLSELPDSMNGEAMNLAAQYCFEMNLDAIKLDTSDAEFFHYMTAKALFLCKRAQPDIHTAVAFLSTGVRAPDWHDYRKLTWMMQYLLGSKNIEFTLEAGEQDPLIIKWWVDSSFGGHPDKKSRTGASMSVGKGPVYSAFSKQKFNSKSSTEARLIGINDIIRQVLWTQYFLEVQGYSVQQSTLYQDTRSAMLLEKNGQAFGGKNTRHINIPYFLVQDIISSGKISLEYCPTENMVDDFFTKPLQGAAFNRFWDAIMNIQE